MYGSATTDGEKPNRQNSHVWNRQGHRGHVTTAIPDAEFRRFGSAAIPYVVRSTIGLLSDSYGPVA